MTNYNNYNDITYTVIDPVSGQAVFNYTLYTKQYNDVSNEEASAYADVSIYTLQEIARTIYKNNNIRLEDAEILGLKIMSYLLIYPQAGIIDVGDINYIRNYDYKTIKLILDHIDSTIGQVDPALISGIDNMHISEDNLTATNSSEHIDSPELDQVY